MSSLVGMQAGVIRTQLALVEKLLHQTHQQEMAAWEKLFDVIGNLVLRIQEVTCEIVKENSSIEAEILTAQEHVTRLQQTDRAHITALESSIALGEKEISRLEAIAAQVKKSIARHNGTIGLPCDDHKYLEAVTRFRTYVPIHVHSTSITCRAMGRQGMQTMETTPPRGFTS